MQESIPVTDLTLDDFIVEGKARIAVKKVTRCPSTTKGIGKFHVNDTMCFDGIAEIQVIRDRKTED